MHTIATDSKESKAYQPQRTDTLERLQIYNAHQYLHMKTS